MLKSLNAMKDGGLGPKQQSAWIPLLCRAGAVLRSPLPG